MSWQGPASAPLGETPGLWSILGLGEEHGQSILLLWPLQWPHKQVGPCPPQAATRAQVPTQAEGWGVQRAGGRHSSWLLLQP